MPEQNQTSVAGIPIHFKDTSIAFKHKSDRELLLSYLIFLLTKRPLLVKFLSKSAKLFLNMGLPVKPLIKATVFKQFCGGETQREYQKVVAQLGRAGIGAILDYSVEGGGDEAGFEETKNAILKTIQQAESDKNIPCACMKMTGIVAETLLEKMTAGHVLSKEDELAWKRLKKRLLEICKLAGKGGTPIYIDAEESWIQGIIDDLAEEMMLTFNREKAVVFTTLQMYRTDRIDYFKRLIEHARRNDYLLGVKIVRGAYMEQERERARQRGVPSPIHVDKPATDRAFDETLRLSMEHMDVVEICAGTHNETSCRLLAGLMAERGIPNDHPHIYFSQLYGMSDHISYNLANAGYNVTKYLPFGPVASTLPYLARRAEENTAIAGQMSKELEIIVRERQRRRAAK
ncbi:MAG: proline dehydrogenase family protein [Deltaproteobacteria bacterium]|jgi:proline dehydrogenase|nr:proline dehydrogenase family protein [Deltaproteobacteria bacterium]